MKLYLAIYILVGAVNAFEDITVVQWLAKNGFTTMTALLHATGLDRELSVAGPFTVFAPTDVAFQQQGINASNVDTAHVKNILQYHVIKQFMMLPQITSYVSVKTLEGHDITLHHVIGGALINNGTHILGQRDVICNNGVVQVIDTVLSPPTQATNLNIAQIMFQQEGKFRDFALSLMMVGMLQLMEGGDYTVFIPNNAAIGALAQHLYDQPAANLQQGAEMMKYYMVPGGRTSSHLHNGQQLFTLHGTPLNVTISATGEMMINDALVVEKDIMATNGVIFVINHILTPQDVLDEIIAGSHAG